MCTPGSFIQREIPAMVLCYNPDFVNVFVDCFHPLGKVEVDY